MIVVAGNAAAQEEGHRIYTAGSHYYKRAVTHTLPATTGAVAFADVPGANAAGGAVALIRPNSVGLVNVRFTAESRCSEPGSAASNYCEVRVLVGGVVASPGVSVTPFAFDSTDTGTEGIGSWEGHALDRHRCIRNTTAANLFVPVQVQWRVTNVGGGAPPSFWLDDWSLTIETAAATTCPAGN